MHICTHTYITILMCVYIYIYIHTYTHIHTYIHTHIHLYIYIYTYVYSYLYTQLEVQRTLFRCVWGATELFLNSHHHTCEELARLAETRLARTTLSYPNMVDITLT